MAPELIKSSERKQSHHTTEVHLAAVFFPQTIGYITSSLAGVLLEMVTFPIWAMLVAYLQYELVGWLHRLQSKLKYWQLSSEEDFHSILLFRRSCSPEDKSKPIWCVLGRHWLEDEDPSISSMVP